MEDILKRLGNVETQVSELRSDVSAILAVIPHLATKADVADLRAELKADIAGLRTEAKADVADLRTALAEVKTSVAAVETAIIKWVVATGLASAALAFTIGKFVH